MPAHQTKSFLFGHTEITYTVRRSKEINAIKITVCGPMVEVKAPAGLRMSTIQSLVVTKADWIIEKLDLTRHHRPIYPTILQSGVAILLLGRQYQLRILPSQKKHGQLFIRARQIELFLPVDSTQDAGHTLIKEALRKKMQECLPSMLKHFSAVLGIQPPPFQVRELGNRWGSCTQKGKLCFHWLLATQEISFIEKVVAHEVCHLIEPRHSAQFKKLTQKIHPS